MNDKLKETTVYVPVSKDVCMKALKHTNVKYRYVPVKE